MLARPRPVLARDVIPQLSRTERPEFAPPPRHRTAHLFLRIPGTFVGFPTFACLREERRNIIGTGPCSDGTAPTGINPARIRASSFLSIS